MWGASLQLCGPLGQEAGRGQGGQGYQQVLLLKLGNLVLGLLLVLLDGFVDTFIEGVKLHFPLLLLCQPILENVQADDDKLVLVGE